MRFLQLGHGCHCVCPVQISLNNLFRCKRLWHDVFSLLFQERRRVRNSPASRIVPERAFGLRALPEAGVGMQHPVPTCCPAGAELVSKNRWATNPGGTPEDAMGCPSPQLSRSSIQHLVSMRRRAQHMVAVDLSVPILAQADPVCGGTCDTVSCTRFWSTAGVCSPCRPSLIL